MARSLTGCRSPIGSQTPHYFTVRLPNEAAGFMTNSVWALGSRPT